MAGGDMNVAFARGVGTMGALNDLNVVDANSTKAGNMTEPRTFSDKDGKTQTLYFTPQGAELFDQYSDPNNSVRPGGPKITVDSDPKGVSSLWKGIVKTEEAIGNPKG